MEVSYASPSATDVSSGDSISGSSMPTRPVKIIPLQHPNASSYSPQSPMMNLFARWSSKVRRMTTIQWIETFLPCYRWIRTYRWREYLNVDLMAGTTVGVMLVPQAMSYAKLAGLQPIYGLYSGFVPIFVYTIFGSSRQLAIGPVALVSLLVSNTLGGIVDSSDELYTELAILLALMVGMMECIMGLLRLGWLIRFISHSVISGFTTASAIVIGLSQIKYFLGYDIARSSKIVPLIKSIISGADQFSLPPFVMGSIVLAIMLVMKHLGKSRKYLRFLRAAGPLTAVVLGTTFVKIFQPSSISLVGDIPQGLPKFSIPKEFGYAKSLIPTALLITGVAILESVGIAKALAAKNGYELDSNQEVERRISLFLDSNWSLRFPSCTIIHHICVVVMDNPVFEENLEIRVSALEGKVEKLSAAMDKFQSFVRDKFATLNIRLARLHHELISQDIRFVEDPNKIKITSSTTSLIVGNVDSTTMDDTSELLVETKKNGIDIVPNYPLLGKRLEVIDYLVFKLPLSVKSREHGSMKMVDGLLNFHIKHGFDCAHKLFVKMPKQKMFSCTSLEFHLEMISLYGTNRFPFDPGIQKIFSCFDIEKRSDETTIRVNSDVWPTEINPRQNKGIEINGCLVGLLEHLLIVFGTMQQYFEKRLVMSEIVYQITRRFDSLHITPRSLDILDSGPAVCGDFVVTLYLQRRGQW